jgi:hypothetical protein
MWQAWQAATGDTFAARSASLDQDVHKLAIQHHEADQFLDGACPEGNQQQCEWAADQFRLHLFGALHGDVGSQQQVASCFESKRYGKYWLCHGVVRPDVVAECAWRLVFLSSGSPKVRSSTAEEYDIECANRSGSEKQAIFGQASQLFQQIYNRPLPRQP